MKKRIIICLVALVLILTGCLIAWPAGNKTGEERTTPSSCQTDPAEKETRQEDQVPGSDIIQTNPTQNESGNDLEQPDQTDPPESTGEPDSTQPTQSKNPTPKPTRPKETEPKPTTQKPTAPKPTEPPKAPTPDETKPAETVPPEPTEKIEELTPSITVKDKKTNEYINKPIDSFNHYIDSLRYSLQCIDDKKKMKTLDKSKFGIDSFCPNV